MGKNLIQQARGKGGPTYRAPSFRYRGKVEYPNRANEGKIIDLVTCQGHSSPLALIEYNDKSKGYLLAPEGIRVGDTIMIGENVPINNGNVMPLKSIPEGSQIYNIESSPGDGGKFVRSSGTFARIISKFSNDIIVLLPSNKKRSFRPDCRATIGIIAGSGRPEKPILKAGVSFYKWRAKNKYWPKVQGVSMNAVDHPFGGRSSAHKGRPTQAPRDAPPGRKVGKIAPRRTGRR